jgi:MFS family permease
MSTDHGTTDTVDPRGWTPRLALSVFCMAMVMEIVSLSYAKVSTALPEITGHFSTTQGGWLLTSSLLFGAVASPLIGRLADLFGKRRMLLAALGIAWIGSVLAATAPNYGTLIAGRLLQGGLIPCVFLTYSLIRDVYPPRTVPLAVSICTGGLGFAAVATPFLNGWLLDTWGWRAIFVFDLLWITVMALAIPASTPETPLRSRARVDLLGAVLLGGGAAAVLVAVSFGNRWGWLSARTLLLAALGVLLIAAWWASAQRIREPLIDLSVISRRPIVAAAVLSGIVYGATVLTSTIKPIMSLVPREAGLGYGLGLTATEYAAIASPNAAMVVVGGLIVGVTVRRVGPRVLMAAGLLLLAAGALMYAYWNATVAQMVAGAVVSGLGAGLGYAAVPNMVIASTPAEEQGAVSSVVQILQTGFSSVMPVVLFAILADNVAMVVSGSTLYTLDGFRYGLFLLAGLAVLGVVLLATVFRQRASEPAAALPQAVLADESR